MSLVHQCDESCVDVSCSPRREALECDGVPLIGYIDGVPHALVVDSGEDALQAMILEGFDLATVLELGRLFFDFAKELHTTGRICHYVVTAIRADEIGFYVQPAQLFLDVLSALRAGDRDGFLALCAAHGGSSQ